MDELTETTLTAPDAAVVANNVRAALDEDVGSGDITAALIAPGALAEGRVITRADGVLCGQAWVDAGDNPALGAGPGRDQRGGDIAAAHILLEGGADIVRHDRGVRGGGRRLGQFVHKAGVAVTGEGDCTSCAPGLLIHRRPDRVSRLRVESR